MAYTRYVAIGDSQTEGLWDGDDEIGVRGFADRLAAHLGTLYPGLQYANLAVRGRTTREVLIEQLPTASAMQPDLVTVCVGMNDVVRPGRAFETALSDLETLYNRLAETGATVATTAFPDVARILPVGRLLAARVTRINAVITGMAHRHGFGLVDLFNAPSMLEPATWSADRMHASSHGHQLFADAAAEALGLPGSSHDWALGSGADERPGAAARVRAQAGWTRNMLAPWIWRHMRGQSSGHGRSPKRPELLGVDTDQCWT
ncbi:SGNH/GDSL hydrolase family protein [Mycolicibacterium mengxianglii]|uniref:SGNH/GDSL hydrolase family protein n=1 Tax=Mycolicibacterium mengxianglii TaxID=2736649 RepID=UPI0018D1D36F|nr:SGNH/GDSL hydrolase family protein [Mycolicibacterium mengxianglii]